MSQIDLQWFSAEEEGKTEEPSEYKLRKARNEEGRVPKSQELNSSLIYVLLIVLLMLLAPWVERKLEEVTIFFFNNITSKSLSWGQIARIFLRYFVMLTIPFSVIGLVAGVTANLVQNKGFIFAPKLMIPKFDQILPNVGKYLKRTMFSFEGAFNVVKSLLKVVVIGFICFILIRRNLPTVLSMLHTAGPALALRQIARMAASQLLVTGLFLLVVGVIDYVVQKRQFMENMKMTKQEVKEEFKELEGDPEVKSRLENAQREMLAMNMPKAVREADVLVTNPTHFAVALKWQRGVDSSPKVTAKGEDMTALNMRRIAREADVPIVENKPLARGLYTDTKVGDIIPDVYLRAIAAVYAQIGYMDRKK